jgi:pimeloyl-ACP methyl ester carboxylesterase
MEKSMTRSIAKPAKASPRTAGSFAAATAAAAAVTALWVRQRARKAESDTPPIGRFLEVDGVRLHYIEQGEGSPVVLLHGNAVLLQDFIGSGLIDRLAQRHRVIAFDRPGFGYSERPRDRLWTVSAQAALLETALAHLDVRQPVVVGHSWGTLVALAIAMNPPADLRGLVLISGYFYPTARLDVALSAPAALPMLGDAMRYTVSPLMGRIFLKQMVKTLFAPAPVPEHFLEVVPREMMLRPSQIRARTEDAAFMVPAAEWLQNHYSKLKLPVSIFAGAGDKIVDAESQSGRLHLDLQNSTLTITPGAGHMMHYTQAQEIAESVDLISQGRRAEQSVLTSRPASTLANGGVA